MDLQKLASDGESALLTVPRADLSAKTTSSLMLLQLPEGWTPADLKDSHFVANNTDEQAALVCKKTSFSLSHVETSNCLVMIPPVQPEETQQDESPTKRAKVSKSSSSSSLKVVPSRLLYPGGSGAAFLELRPKKLRLADLRRALASEMLDPYNNSSNSDAVQGRSLDGLFQTLQQSKYELLQGLKKLPGVYEISPSNYCLLSEEVQLTVYHAILSTLAEAEGCQDYAENGIENVEGFVQQTVAAMSQEERFDQAAGVVRHCLMQLADDSHPRDPLRLCVSEVARWVARRLFSLQSSPWEETLLLARWQSQIPGVGDAYQVSTRMLKGLAVVSDGEQERFWKYLPADQILQQGEPHKAFAALFEWKDKWLLDEMQPYLDVIMDATAVSRDDLLVRYTKLTTEDFQGTTIKLYQKR